MHSRIRYCLENAYKSTPHQQLANGHRRSRQSNVHSAKIENEICLRTKENGFSPNFLLTKQNSVKNTSLMLKNCYPHSYQWSSDQEEQLYKTVHLSESSLPQLPTTSNLQVHPVLHQNDSDLQLLAEAHLRFPKTAVLNHYKKFFISIQKKLIISAILRLDYNLCSQYNTPIREWAKPKIMKLTPGLSHTTLLLGLSL